MEVDVSRRDQVEALAALAMRTYGRIDTWVNNAGVSIYGRFEDDHRGGSRAASST